MNSRTIDNAIQFAIEEVRFQISECIINRDFETAKLLNEIKEDLYNVQNKLPF